MPPKAGGHRKGRKKIRDTGGSKDVLLRDDDAQQYGQIVKVLGGGRFTAHCFDGQPRLCVLRGSMRRGGIQNRVGLDDIVLVSLRDYQDGKADIVHRYTLDDARKLKMMGELPANAALGASGMGVGSSTDDATLTTGADDTGFDFESI